MRFGLLLLFIGVPLLEMAVLIQLGRFFGLWSTLAIIILTGFAGAALARRQGMRVLMRMQEEMHAGRIPAAEMVDGLLILIAGVMLITPGFLSDVSGLLLLLPGVRHFVRNWLRQKLTRMMQSGRTHIFIRDHDFFSKGPS